MSSSLLTQTAQAACLSATSNVLAQLITIYNDDTPFMINIIPILQFVIFSFISTPPNVLWQRFLEQKFPTSPTIPESPIGPREKIDFVDADTKKELVQQAGLARKGVINVRNVLKKVALDQSFGAIANTLLFIIGMSLLNGAAWNEIVSAVQRKALPLFLNGLKVWPLFSIVSFSMIPVEKRIVAGASVGVLWGIYLSMVAARR